MPNKNKAEHECEVLAFAQHYAKQGWSVFPLHSIKDGKCACGARDCTAQGKHPILSNGFKKATTNEDQIQTWFGDYFKGANIGVCTGAISGIVVIDIDSHKPEGVASLEKLEALIDSTGARKQATGGGGEHWVFKYPAAKEIRCRTNWLPGIDVRADGGYIVAAPSLHKSGGVYEWEY